MVDCNIKITAEPVTAAVCKFTIDRPVYENKSFHFGSREAAEDSPLARRLFELEGVKGVLISHDQVTVTQQGHVEWPVLGKQVGAAIREHVAGGEPAVSEEARRRLPSPDELRGRVQEILDQHINPSVAAHGGVVRLVDVKDNNVLLQMGGGCQGCGMASLTLRQGVETAIRARVPEVGEIVDITDHAAGQNPYYARM